MDNDAGNDRRARSACRWTREHGAGPPPPQQRPAQPQPAQSAQAVSAQEHLSQAKAAADAITQTSVPAKSRTQLAQLKKQLAALEKAESATPAGGTAAKSNANWATDVAAIDKIATEMLGSETAAGT